MIEAARCARCGALLSEQEAFDDGGLTLCPVHWAEEHAPRRGALRAGDIVKISGYDEEGPFLAQILCEYEDGSLAAVGFRENDLPLEATLARDRRGRWWLCEEPLRYRPYERREYSLLPYRGGIIVRRRCALEPLHVMVRRASDKERAIFHSMQKEWNWKEAK